MNRRRTALLSLTGLLATALTALPAAPAGADEVEQVRNGTFDTTTEPWWASTGVTTSLSEGRLCADVPGGTANRWDAAVGQNDITLVKGESYRFSFTASGAPAGGAADSGERLARLRKNMSAFQQGTDRGRREGKQQTHDTDKDAQP